MSQRHAYLGDLEEVQRPQLSLFADGTVMALPILFLRDVVLFPGEEIPLRMLSDTSMEAIRDQLSNEGALLGIVSPGQEEPVYGTTVRIDRFNLVEHCASLTGVAKQRFRLRQITHGHDSMGVTGDVEILGDLLPRLPLPAPVVPARREKGRRTIVPPNRLRRASRYPFFWDYSVYSLFDAYALVDRIQRMMVSSAQCNWFQQWRAQDSDEVSLVSYLTTPSHQVDPVRFAFWIAGNLPLSHAERLELLRIAGVVQLLRRLIVLLSLLHEDIFCVRCGSKLSKSDEIFSMSQDGTTGTFVNPAGFVHQIMTLKAIQRERVFVDPNRSTEDSWFPGYSWSIVYCRGCSGHLGWQFDRTEESQEPARFFGFRRSSLTQSWAMNRDVSPLIRGTSSGLEDPFADHDRSSDEWEDVESHESFSTEEGSDTATDASID
ncbi:hypothetical protein PINS_up008950 [Pythium insidiosum]|nr:hypothetical protein PINS_up008950 [Pythium insidiosum]